MVTAVPAPAPRDAAAVLQPGAPLSAAFTDAVARVLTTFCDEQAPALAAMGPELAAVQSLATRLLAGGKRLRPAFCVWGYVAAAGLPTGDPTALLRAAASLDVLHVSALVHDDVMDGSDLRRGQPAAHRQFEVQHTASGRLGDPAAFGRAGAILLGDLLVMWSVQLLQRCGLDPAVLDAATPIAETMRTEVTCGQYLDIVAQSSPLGEDPTLALDEAERVVEYKSARYTVQRPCQLGAALGGGDERLQAALAAYGSPLGRAFQFRDDELGVFGDSTVTGKPAGDDLREGKRTVLIAHAYAHAGPAGQQLLRERLGDPALDAAGVAALQQVIDDSGARDAVEAMIEQGYQRSLVALEAAELTDAGRQGLTALAEAAVRRVF
ncbi:polyprenyl synthetase family protein [uncultured Friedmanniella sp.]|uniref:polyprenyl synthetase family protein n=1 Tax=uncultured Friedmanniella sp. TaxID=335381 RepID=UPI0035CB99AD